MKLRHYIFLVLGGVLLLIYFASIGEILFGRGSWDASTLIGSHIALLLSLLLVGMGLRPAFTPPEWKHSHWFVRKAAVEKLTDPALLAEIAKRDSDEDVREAAVKKLAEQTLLGEMWRCSTCGEEIEDSSLEMCWNCHAPRRRKARVDVPKNSTRVFFLSPGLRHDGTCEICKGTDSAAEYRYYPPEKSETLLDTPIRKETKYTYSSLHYVDVLICDRCVAAKRKQALLWYALGFIISAPLAMVFFGIFGVVWFGSGLLKLRTKEETGDILAYNWFEEGKYQFALMGMGSCKTRRQFAHL